jgi:AcrR family transcriptional regulator
VSTVTEGPAVVSDRQEPSRGRGRPRDQRASTAITEAALRQLRELGYAKVSMESVAAEAGVARTTIYRRYRDKADLITAAIAANSTAHLVDGPSDDPRRDLVAYLSEFDRRFAEGCLEVVGTLIGMREDPCALDLHRHRVVEPRLGYARSLVVRAQELGHLAEDADVDLALQMLVGSVFARRVAGHASTPGWADRAVDAIWTGMGAGQKGERGPGARRQGRMPRT